MNTKEKVEQKAREVAEWSAKVKAFGMENAAGMTPEEAVASEAAMMIAGDAPGGGAGRIPAGIQRLARTRVP